ncbi:MAG TPA: hypothetical protein VFZ24_02735 [Longimicrobiales bacterium]
MKSKLVVLTLAALLTAPAALRAQSAEAGAAAQARAGTPEARIEAALQTALSAGIPQALLESKIAEGKAKGVAMERIAAAVEARAQALVRAQEMYRRAHVDAESAGELAVTADALEAGVSENAVIRITRGAPAERRAVAVAVLADLVRLGHPTDHAFARVNAAMANSASLANLHAEVAAQLRLGGMRSTLDAAGGVRIR